MNLQDLRFDGNTKEQIRYTIQNLLKEFLPAPDPKYKNSVILPSFVDLSNQQLTAVPDFILEMKGIQTLYLHFNQVYLGHSPLTYRLKLFQTNSMVSPIFKFFT